MRSCLYILLLLLLQTTLADAQSYARTIGQKQWETANHLGNVLATTTDRKVAEPAATTTMVAAYEADVVSYGDYYPYGMGMEGRRDVVPYRYGFNGMEADEEVSGEKTSYSTYYRRLSSSLGRWVSIDPVIHSGLSSYNAFDNNPLLIVDPHGADGGSSLENGTYYIESTIYFRFDPELKLTPDQKLEYMQKFQDNVRAMWNIDASNGLNGNSISADWVDFVEAPIDMTTSQLKKNENLLVVGNNPIPGKPDVSHVEGRKKNTGWMDYSMNGSEGGHEFGHMLGLADRYEEALTLNRGRDGYIVGNRQTIPLLIGDENNPAQYQHNNMASSGGIFTSNQLRIAMNRNRSEKTYSSGLLYLPPMTYSQQAFKFQGLEYTRKGLIPIDGNGNRLGIPLQHQHTAIIIKKNQEEVLGITNRGGQHGSGGTNDPNKEAIKKAQSRLSH